MPERPNILLLHCHDLGTLLHCYGVDTVRTPNLDRFAGEGVRFARSYCSAPQCSPSRASLFTGRWPHNNGVMGLCHSHFAWNFHPEERHLGQLLRDAGYATAAVGVIHETCDPPPRCGYDVYDPDCRVSAMAGAAIARLEDFARTPGKPFFLSAGSIEPHRLPMVSDDYIGFLHNEFGPDNTLGVQPAGFLKDTPGTRAEWAELQGAVHHLDTHMGRVLEAVDRLGLRDNTLVVFTTDHGYAMPRAKCTLYDPGIAVALMMRLPGREGWRGGGDIAEMVSNIDVLPTLLELAGCPMPENVQGRSFAPLLDGRAYAPREEVFAELTYHDYYDPMRAVRTERHKLIANFSAAPAFMDCTQSWRPRSDTAEPAAPAMAYHPPIELYDLREDPWEQRNLADDPAHAATRDALLARLHLHMCNTADPLLDGAVTSPMHLQSMDIIRRAGQ